MRRVGGTFIPERIGRTVAAVGLVLVVVSSAFGAWLAYSGYVSERDAREDDLRARVTEAASIVATLHEGEIRTLQAVAAAPSVASADVALIEQYFHRADPDATESGGGFAWIDQRGDVRVRITAAVADLDLARLTVVRDTLDTGTPQVSDALMSLGGVAMYAVTAPVVDPAGRPSGVVVRTQRLDVPNPLVDALAEIPDAYVLDREGRVLATGAPVGPGELVTVPAELLALRGTAAMSSTGLVPGERLATTATVQPTGWSAVVERARSDVLATTWRRFVGELVGLAVLGSGALAGLFLLARRSQRHANRNAALREANAQAAALQQIAAALSASLTPGQVASVVGAQVRDALDADGITLGLVDPQHQRVDWLLMQGYPEEMQEQFRRRPLGMGGIVAEVVEQLHPVVVAERDAYLEDHPQLRSAVAAMPFASMVLWPLEVEDDCIGVMGVMWRAAHSLDPGERRFIDTVADLVARGVTRAVAYADEHAVAAALQRSVSPAPRNITGLQVAGEFRPATARATVCGDWYDAYALADERVLLVVGDVVGHGLDAAEDMAQLRNVTRGLALAGHGPASMLRELDRFTARDTRGRYATMAVMVFDVATGRLVYATAGHPPPMLRSPSGTVVLLANAAGPSLGALPGARYHDEEIELAEGCVLVSFSDGLVERRDEGIDDGLRRLADALATADPQQLHALPERLIGACSSGDAHTDDICVLVARRPVEADDAAA